VSNQVVPTTMSSWVDFYSQGGTLMHAIFAIGCVGFAVAIEGAWSLLVRLDGDARRLRSVVESRFVDGDTKGAVQACVGRSSAVARILRAGLMASVDRDRTRAAVREAQLQIEVLVRRRLPMLSTLAGLAILVGLLGTVFGLISGFSCPVTVSADQRAAALARSLGIAVHTTGFGLLVAIPLLVARLVVFTAAEKIKGDVAHTGAWIVDLVAHVRAPKQIRDAPYR
jgi:biopolymer transport protein ExbB/TolQ